MKKYLFPLLMLAVLASANPAGAASSLPDDRTIGQKTGEVIDKSITIIRKTGKLLAFASQLPKAERDELILIVRDPFPLRDFKSKLKVFALTLPLAEQRKLYTILTEK